jgi:hypothetical protein
LYTDPEAVTAVWNSLGPPPPLPPAATRREEEKAVVAASPGKEAEGRGGKDRVERSAL